MNLQKMVKYINMLLILKNNRIDHKRNEYILFDTEGQEKSKINLKPSNAKILAEQYNMFSISPMDAMKYFRYKEVEFGLFIPLCF